MWWISSCWIRMDGEDLKKKSLGNFITITGDPNLKGRKHVKKRGRKLTLKE